MTYVQCFILCFREEGPRAVTALYFGWPAFRNRHFVIWGGGGGALYSSLLSNGEVRGIKSSAAQFDCQYHFGGGQRAKSRQFCEGHRGCR